MKSLGPAIALLLAFAALAVGSTALAHFKLNLNVRIFHVVHSDDGLDIYLRTPMPYLVADKIGPIGTDGLPRPAPYTSNRLEDGILMHLIAADAVIRDPVGLAQIAADELVIREDSMRLAVKVVSGRVYPTGLEPAFATQAEAEAALSKGPAFPPGAGEAYVGDALVDLHLKVSTGSAVGDYSLAVASDPNLPGQADTANLLLDYRDGSVRTYRSRGLLNAPIVVKDSSIAAATTFLMEGIRHILEGLDHVLFVICMILGAATLRNLVARVSGFTVGHTVTLIAGFFGLAPQGAWFIPTVETLIAMSIIFTAADVVLRPTQDAVGNGRAITVTSTIGLLHGFGFSFMLHNILKVDAPNVWQNLLAFNIGVEVGQLLIVAAIWPAVLLLRNCPAPVWRIIKVTMAACASLIATVWMVVRATTIFA